MQEEVAVRVLVTGTSAKFSYNTGYETAWKRCLQALAWSWA